MKKKRAFTARYISLAVFFILVCLIYIGRLINIQIAGQDFYTMTAGDDYVYRTETIQAQRGELFDRNGVPLVVNEYTYSINLDGGSMPYAQSEKNTVILAVLQHANDMDEMDSFTLPASPFTLHEGTDGKTIHFEYNNAYFETSAGKKFYKLVTNLSCTEDSPAEDTAAALLKRYGLVETDEDGNRVYRHNTEETALLLAVRLDMELQDFSPVTPYTLLRDVSFPLLSRVKEAGLRGIDPHTDATRAYTYPGYASHILGRVGKIRPEYVEYYTDRGYPLDAIVGISGAEQAFEEYLHGVDGIKTIVEDAYGNIVDEYIAREPRAGSNVYLTIDIEMQIKAEDALASNIQYIVDTATASGKELSGEDADSGALTAVDVQTGDVLALASYPTYNLATYQQDVGALNTDPRGPLYNRALSGTYPPGSTFKIGVAAAALTENVITPQTKIHATGIYEYYSTYTPTCWIYNMYGGSHGSINVTTAIQESCNYFFYEVGRLLTIETMNRYDRAFGLGVPTGIELGERTGVLAGPDYRNENGLGAWNPGDTLAAAIGQSDNLFTPLQISVYMSSILNGGTRMKAHILSKVESFYTGEVLYKAEPVIADASIKLSPDVHTLLLNAMRRVTENGSAARVFSTYPIEIGGKTGTSQVNANESNHAIFTAFAPFDAPRIAVTCIIEHGANGTDAGYAVRDVFDYYFDLK